MPYGANCRRPTPRTPSRAGYRGCARPDRDRALRPADRRHTVPATSRPSTRARSTCTGSRRWSGRRVARPQQHRRGHRPVPGGPGTVAGPALADFTSQTWAMHRDDPPRGAPTRRDRGTRQAWSWTRRHAHDPRRAGERRGSEPPARTSPRTADGRAVPMRAASRRPRRLPRLHQTLDDQLGLDPSSDLRDLEQAILRQDGQLGGPPASCRASARNLPVRMTSFVGRERSWPLTRSWVSTGSSP